MKIYGLFLAVIIVLNPNICKSDDTSAYREEILKQSEKFQRAKPNAISRYHFLKNNDLKISITTSEDSCRNDNFQHWFNSKKLKIESCLLKYLPWEYGESPLASKIEFSSEDKVEILEKLGSWPCIERHMLGQFNAYQSCPFKITVSVEAWKKNNQ